MKRPSFQFYPADWRNNAKLRRCSEAARGAWMDVLCVLHDSDEYGVLRWPLADIARAAGVPLKMLRELAAKDVLKGADGTLAAYVYTPRHAGRDGAPVVLVEDGPGPCWYCSRLVRDEWIRQRRGKSTQFSDEHQPPKYQPKPPIGDGSGDGPTSSSSSTSKSNTPIPPEGGKPSRRKPAIALHTFLDECKAIGVKPIPEGAPVFAYAEQCGIPQEFLRLQWLEFKDRYGDGSKRYKDWPLVFSKSVRGNWFKLWFADRDGGGYKLTTIGVQAENTHKGKR